MALVDSNVWLALVLSKHVLHPTVRDWMKGVARREAAFCRATQQSFLRLLTTAAVLAPYGVPPLSNKAAWSAYEDFRADGRVVWAAEPRGLEGHWKKFAGGPNASPKLWMDAYLAAFAIAGGHQLVTTDKAFGQFKGLDVLVLEPAGAG
ncbi:MAG TPA: TA system VapC family ribonuclease toxin [Gemmataceae bacterium]|nr:TA system VapC family ribonuclease toxin [Gemmataceae bacterium]